MCLPRVLLSYNIIMIIIIIIRDDDRWRTGDNKPSRPVGHLCQIARLIISGARSNYDGLEGGTEG